MREQNKHPLISVIVPCYNEERTIQLLLTALYHQTYPIKKMEVVISDALSTDNTREKIQEFLQKNPDLDVRVVDNNPRTIPAGVNSAASAARGEILVRLDAHSEPNPEYIETSVALLVSGKADNVGGVWQINPGADTCIARAIALAAANPLGVGDAKYRVSTKAQYVDTVPFGAFYRDKFFATGAFDETLLANEDYEFNARLQQGGGKVYMDPRIISRYHARPNLRKLAVQYWRYGFWKVKMLQRFPDTLRLRQAIPPLFVSSLGLMATFAIVFPFARIILLGEIILYLCALIAAGMICLLKEQKNECLLMPAAIVVMHFSWGTGFLYSLIRSLFKGNNEKNEK
jgi:succinoglycan biosynthesis protein ExoA